LFVLIAGASTGAALGAWTAGAATAAALGWLCWRRAAPRGVEPEFAGVSAEHLSALAKDALPFLGVAVLALALPWISTLALALRGDEAEVGIFAVAYRTATLTSFVLVAVNAAAGPRFAALVARGDRRSLARTARRTALATGVCALPLIAVAWTAPGWVMSLFGAEFAAHGRVLAILATGQLVNVLTGSVGALLLMSGHERALRGNLVGATALSLALHAWLVPSYGPEGAAWASAASLAALNVASLVSVRRRLAIAGLPLPFLRAQATPGAANERGAHG
jgi:O-antigen/teichoic acid export membrane protein